MSMRIRVSEDTDAYFRDFASNSSWDYVFSELDRFISDLQFKAAYTDENHAYWKGEWQGALQTIGFIKSLLRPNKG